MIRTARAALLALGAGLAGAGEGPLALIAPEIRDFTLAASAGYDLEPRAERDGLSYERSVTRAGLRAQAWSDERSEVVLSTGWAGSDADTDAERVGVHGFPDRLHELRFGVVARRVTAERGVYGVSLTVGSDDRDPFASSEGLVLSGLLFARLPMRRDAWLLTLSYTNDATFLNGIPLPGAAYEWRPSPELLALFGFPFSFARWRPAESWSFDAAASVFGTLRGSGSWQPLASARWLRLQAGVDWGAETWRWPNRIDEDDRVYFRSLRATGGVGVQFGPMIGASLAAGWAWEREVVIGESIRDDDQRLDLPDGAVVALSLRAGF